jgi:Amidohydrolase
MIIDAWMQHPNAEWIRNPMFDSLRRWKPGKWSEMSQPIEATLAEMDQAGISVGMLCAWHGPSGPMISNDEVAHYCRAHPGRFVGIASVDLYRPMDGVRELRRRVRQDGFKGLRVLPWVRPLDRKAGRTGSDPNVAQQRGARCAARMRPGLGPLWVTLGHCSDVRCTAALRPKAEVHWRSCYVAQVP